MISFNSSKGHTAVGNKIAVPIKPENWLWWSWTEISTWADDEGFSSLCPQAGLFECERCKWL